jgi:Tol biopolymer transport system component
MQRIRRILLAGGLVLAAAMAAVVIWVGRGGVRVVSVVPAAGAGDAPITAPIRLLFSQPMQPESVEAHLRLEPEVPGRVVGQGKEILFQPQPGWTPQSAYTVTLEAGALSERGRPLKTSRTWRFRTRAPQLLYLGRFSPGDDVRQIFLAPLDGSAPQQLTDHAVGVWDYTVDPLGTAIVYSVLREDGGSDLWRMDRDGANRRLLLACPGAACLNPAWSPDGSQLAYERRDIWHDAPNLDPSAARIWLFDLKRAQERPLFDYDVPAHSPVWSASGQELAYVSPLLPGIEVYDLATGEFKEFENEWGTAPTWSPDGRLLAMSDLLLIGGDDSAGSSEQASDHEGEALAVRLVRADLESGAVVDISGDDDLVKDSAAAWSPAGGWIAVARQFLDEARWTPARQIWLTRPDAGEAYALLTEPMADHFAFAWRPDAGALAYLSTDLSEGPQPVPQVSVWYFDFSLGRPVPVADSGVLPRWLP